VHGVVVALLDPGGEPAVELGEGQIGEGCGLDQELAADGLQEPFDLPLPLRLTGQSQLGCG